MNWIIIGLDHYSDVIMGAIASQLTSLKIVYSSVYSGADQRKHQSWASRWPMNSPQKGPVTWKIFHLMTYQVMACRLFCAKPLSKPSADLSAITPRGADFNHDDVIKWKLFLRFWPFARETTGHRWIHLTKASHSELLGVVWSTPEQTVCQTIGTPLIWDAIALMMTPL